MYLTVIAPLWVNMLVGWSVGWLIGKPSHIFCPGMLK